MGRQPPISDRRPSTLGKHRSILLGALFALTAASIVAGCTRARPVVYVDLSKAVSARAITPVAVVPNPIVPPAFQPSTLSLPALPATTYQLGSDQGRVKQVQDILAKNREQAIEQIGAGLRETYLRDVRHTQAQELAKLGPQLQQANAAALAENYRIFSAYAIKRGPLVAELALLAGFPDTDPTSQKTPPRRPSLLQRFNRAKELRTQIASLDADYQKQKGELYVKVGLDAQVALKKINDEIAQLTAQADERARTEALQEVSREQAQLTAVLADKGAVSFPAEPGRSVTVQGTQKRPPVPVVDVPGAAAVKAQELEAAKSDLQVWAAVRGYVISSDRTHARDATAEFIAWRKTALGTP